VFIEPWDDHDQRVNGTQLDADAGIADADAGIADADDGDQQPYTARIGSLNARNAACVPSDRPKSRLRSSLLK
jgi:hypothetical protein